MLSIDEILYDLIKDKLAAIKSDPSILDKIFEGRTTERIESMKQFIISNKNIRVVLHHPRDAADFPCYSIVLESSNESEQVIDGGITDEFLISDMSDGWVGSDSDIFRSNIYLPVDISQTYSALEVKDGRRSCHIKAKKDSSVGKGVWIDFTNSVLGGYVSLEGIDTITFFVKSNRSGSFLEFGFGEKQHREQTFNFSITNKGVWEIKSINIKGIADRDKNAVRYMSFKVTDDSLESDVYVARLIGEKEPSSEYKEAFFDSRYRIEVWTDNAELTLNLWIILLWNLLKYRDYLEQSWGIMEQTVGGGDVAPQPEYYPEFVYIRGLVFSCKTIEVVPGEELTALDVRVGRQDLG